jgi:hypothetical protein
MSRGLGPLQERLLEALADGRLYRALDLAVTVYDIQPSADGLRYVSEVQSVAVRRALNGLMKRKRVCWTRRGDVTAAKLWGLDKDGTATPPLSLRQWSKAFGPSRSTFQRALKKQRTAPASFEASMDKIQRGAAHRGTRSAIPRRLTRPSRDGC